MSNDNLNTDNTIITLLLDLAGDNIEAIQASMEGAEVEKAAREFGVASAHAAAALARGVAAIRGRYMDALEASGAVEKAAELVRRVRSLRAPWGNYVERYSSASNQLAARMAQLVATFDEAAESCAEAHGYNKELSSVMAELDEREQRISLRMMGIDPDALDFESEAV